MVEAILSPRAHMASLGGPEIAGRENGSATDRQSVNLVHGGGGQTRESKDMGVSS